VLESQLRLLRAYALVTYPFACVPFLFLWFQRHGLDTAGYGQVIAVYYAAMFVAEVPTGIAADRFGPKSMMVLGPLLLAAGFLTVLLWPTLAGFCAGEALLGLGHAVLSGPPATILYETLREHGQEHRYLTEESRCNSRRLAGTGSAFLFGGALAEGLGDAAGPAYAATIVLTCGGNAIAALIGLCLRPEPGRPVLPLAQFAATLQQDLARPAVRWLLAYWVVLFALLRFPFHNYQPYLDEAAAVEPAFRHPLAVGGIYAALNLIAAPCSRRVPQLVARTGRRALFWGMPLLLAATLLWTAWERNVAAAGAGSRMLAWCGIAVFVVQQLPFGAHWALLQEFVNRRIQPGARTTVMSALSLAARLCYAAVNVLLFGLQQRAGMATACLVAGLGGAAATTAVMLLRPKGLLRDD
jgi:MFS family permease